ncbi:MAG: capsule biosynthesis protein, partial [Geobacteraceae bacterium]
MGLKKIKKLVFRKNTQEVNRRFWERIIKAQRAEWEQALYRAQKGPKILIATSTGKEGMARPVESLLAVALTLRGANVHILLCDQFLPACSIALSTMMPDLSEFVAHGLTKRKCLECHQKGVSTYEALGLPIFSYRRLVAPDDIQKAEETAGSVPTDMIPAYRWNGMAVGEHALAGALRFFARGDLDGEPHAAQVLQRYFKAALLTAVAMRNLLRDIHFDCAVFHHGIYIPQGIIGEVARSERVRVVNWVRAYRNRCFIFSHNDTYHHTMMTEPTGRWDNMSWNLQVEQQLLEYLKSRWQGTMDWVSFLENPQFDLHKISNEIGVDFSKPTIGLLTNVIWDAQLHYPANAFRGMVDWVLQTISYFAKRSDLQLLIRVHPAELTGMVPSRQLIVDEIRTAFPELPQNVFVVPPESRVSTYAAMLQCDAVIIYGTKTGVELTSMGVPVIVAGEAWIRNKGITLDANSPEGYFRFLDLLPLRKRMEETQIQRARKYAYHFFFRRMIPMEFFESTERRKAFKLTLRSIEDLKPGKSSGLDIICDEILKGTA